MAYLLDYEQTFLNGASTALNLTMPTHATGDVLVIFITQDANTTITLNTGGWTQIGSQTNGGTGVTSAAWYKKAASSSEVANITTTDGWIAWVFSIRDVDTTTQLDTSSFTGTGTAASEITSTSVTTNTADCFILYCVGNDGVATQCHSDPGVMSIGSADDQGTTATTAAASSAAWYIQRSAGATPAPTWTKSLSNAYTLMTLAFRNKSGGIIPPYIDDVSSPGTKLAVGHHFSTLNGISFPGSLSLGNIGPGGTGKATAYDAATAIADYGINPYSSALSSTLPTTAATSVSGYEIAFSSANNLSTGFVMGSVIALNPKMANYFQGSIADGGMFVAFADASNNYRSYQVLARDSNPNTEGRSVWSIKPSQTTTAYGTSGSMNASAVTKMLLLSNCPRGAITLYSSEIHQVNTQVIAGGDSNFPVDAEGVAKIGKSFRLSVIQKTGAAGLLAYVPIQVGGGDSVNFQINAGSLQFPRASSQSTGELNYHGDAGAIGISYAGKSGDVIKHTNSVVTSPSSYYWEIHSAATSAATWDFAGLTVVGAVVTLRNVMTFSEMTFSSCSAITASSCAVNTCTFSKVPSSSNSMTLNSTTTFTSCAINVATVTAGNYWVSTATPNQFTSCTFTGGGGHAIRITTPGTYNLVGNIFTGFGATSSTGAAIYNDSGGAVTLNISGGGSSPTYLNGTNAVTTVNANVNVTITVLNSSQSPVVGASVYVFKNSDSGVIINTTTNASGVATGSTSSGAGAISIRIRKSTIGSTRYVPNESSGTVAGIDFSSTIILVTDTIVN